MEVALKKPLAMKPIFALLLGVSALAATTSSCTKEAHNEPRQQTEAIQVINTNLAAGETYSLNLGAGTKATIINQAAHFQVSELATASDGSVLYRYSGGKGFSGADEVTLQQIKTTMASGGSGCGAGANNYNSTTEVKTMVVKFLVTN